MWGKKDVVDKDQLGLASLCLFSSLVFSVSPSVLSVSLTFFSFWSSSQLLVSTLRCKDVSELSTDKRILLEMWPWFIYVYWLLYSGFCFRMFKDTFITDHCLSCLVLLKLKCRCGALCEGIPTHGSQLVLVLVALVLVQYFKQIWEPWADSLPRALGSQFVTLHPSQPPSRISPAHVPLPSDVCRGSVSRRKNIA